MYWITYVVMDRSIYTFLVFVGVCISVVFLICVILYCRKECYNEDIEREAQNIQGRRLHQRERVGSS